MRPQPLIAVADVAASSRWYRRLLDCQRGHGGPDHEQLLREGEILLQLHRWENEDHPNLGDPNAAAHGYGVLLWFETGAFAAAVARARELRAEIVEEPRVNPNSPTVKSGCAIPTAMSSSSPAARPADTNERLPTLFVCFVSGTGRSPELGIKATADVTLNFGLPFRM